MTNYSETIVNPNKALWEKGDFTQIAAFMRQSGEAIVDSLGVTPQMKVQDLHLGCYAEGVHNCFPRLAHEGSNLCEVPFFPECLVWIHDSFRIVCHDVLPALCSGLTGSVED